MKSDMLGLTMPMGKTLTFTIVLLFLFGGMSEWIASSEVFRLPVTPPKMGSRHYQLGHKLVLLDRLIRKNGRVDCMMLGSSIVDNGFNPAAFEIAYKEMTGWDIFRFFPRDPHLGTFSLGTAGGFAVVECVAELAGSSNPISSPAPCRAASVGIPLARLHPVP